MLKDDGLIGVEARILLLQTRIQ